MRALRPSSTDPCDWIAEVAAARPDAPFIVGGASYGQLAGDVARLAGRLIALGVKPGDRVTAQIEKSPEALTLYLACLWMGAVYMPLNTGYTESEFAYFIEDADPALIVLDPANPLLPAYGARCATLGSAGDGTLLQDVGPPVEQTPAQPGDLAAMCYTSGTTGRPKGAMISRGALASNAVTLVEAWRFTQGDFLLHALPVYHVHGLFVATNTVLAAGSAMIFHARFDADAVLANLPRSTVLMGVPTFYTRLLQKPEKLRAASKNVRLFVSGSAPLLAETHAAFERVTGQAILERYGMTETLMNTSNPYDGARVAGTVGPPLPGVSLRITDPESGAPLPQGEIGMIEVKGANLFKGYWRNPEKTAAEHRADGHFITGDLGRIDDAGYVHIVGRGKDLIISGGLNIYPKEVESEIDALPGVIESAVIGVPHPDFGEAVVAVIAAISPVDPSEVSAALGERLARFKLPKHVEIVEDLPRNAMGKVQKALLRDRFGGLFAD